VNPESSIQNRVSIYLRAYKAPSTLVEDSLQIDLFMQNKPNFRKAKMNINTYYTKAYNNKTAFRRVKNKPNSNPIKPNFQNAKMNISSLITKDYRKKDDFIVRINKPNFQNGKNERKLNFNKGLQKKRSFSRPKNKPNSNPILTAVGGFRKSKISLKTHHHPDNTCCIRKARRII
jgi:hypothetical protein